MTVTEILIINALVLAVCFAMLWFISLRTRDVTPVDSFWALGMVIMGLMTYAQTA